MSGLLCSFVLNGVESEWKSIGRAQRVAVGRAGRGPRGGGVKRCADIVIHDFVACSGRESA